MRQGNIVILDRDPAQRIGSQLRAILKAHKTFAIHLTEEFAVWCRDFPGLLPQIVIPILPRSLDKAHCIIEDLRVVTQPPLVIVPVVAASAIEDLLTYLVFPVTDFLVSPLRDLEVRARLDRILQQSETDRHDDVNEGITAACGLAHLIGEHPVFTELRRKLPLVAQFESTVLLTGETGTGKERCARALHYCSRRAGNAFLPVNCGCIPVDLFESELYGHQRGAFTGAFAAQPGFVAEAEHGTLFLDEIEALSLTSQVKLLRFLQDRTYYPLGSTKPKQANVWIIASSNVDLSAKVKENTFREDLFYRLAVITLDVPPLRNRSADIPLLANHFLALYTARHGNFRRRFSPEAMDLLTQYSWPGNVRELQNLVQYVIVLTNPEIIRAEDLPIFREKPPARAEASFRVRKAQVIEQFERTYISELLRIHGGNVTHAALAANKERRAFGRLIRKYNLVTNG